MWKPTKTILFLGLVIIAESTLAANAVKQLPSIVGPGIYELYTDANYFVTHVYVNGIKRKLSNAKGNGSMARNGYGFSGPMGYENKLILNGYLRAGKNTINVVFEPSSILADARKQGVENMIIRDMFAHAVIVRGQLSKGSLGVESYNLDQLIMAPNLKAAVMKNKLLRRFTADKLSDEVSVSYEFDLHDNDKSIRSTIGDCSLSTRASNNFTATLMLNDKPVKWIKDNSSRGVENFSEAIKQGENIFKLNVASINKAAKKNSLYLYLECDLAQAINEIGFSPEHKRLDFGDFFKKVYLPLVTIEFVKKGEYVSNFEFDL